MKLRIVRPALTSSTTDNATSATTRNARVLPPADAVEPRDSSLSASTRSGRDT